QGVDLGARLANDDPRTSRMDVHGDLAALLDDVDVREPGVRELLLDVVADRHVLEQQVGEVALVEPVRLPVVDVADAEALGVNLLSHAVYVLLRRPWSGSGPPTGGLSSCRCGSHGRGRGRASAS